MGEKEDYELDDDLVLGPKENRTFTDIICCIVFLVFLFSIAWFSILAFINGDISRIAQPLDKNKSICGAEIKGFQYVFLDPTEISLNASKAFENRVCTKNCPLKGEKLECASADASYCDAVSVSSDTALYFDRFCLPSSKELLNKVLGLFSGLGAQGEVEGVFDHWWILILAAIVAIAVSMLIIIIMKCLAPLFVCLMIVLVACGLGYIGWLSQKVSMDAGAAQDNFTGTDYNQKESLQSQQTSYLWICIAFWCFDALFLALLLCMCGSIRAAINVLEAASDFMQDCTRVVLVPLFTTSVFVVFVFLWAITYVFSYSDGEVVKNSQVPFTSMLWDDSQLWRMRILIIALAWISAFILSYTYFVISAQVTEWYFRHEEGVRCDLTMSMRWGMWYHFGSIAFGSFILACVWIIRGMVIYITEKIKKANPGNGCVNCMVNCTRCLCYCFEKWIKFINKHAYTEIALRSKSFCYCAMEGFKVVLTNTTRFGFQNFMTELLGTFLSQSVTLLTTFLVWLFLQSYEKDQPAEFKSTLLIMVCFVEAFIIGKAFLAVYDIASDVIMHCYCIDHFHHKKRGMDPQFARQKLKDFAEKHEVPADTDRRDTNLLY